MKRFLFLMLLGVPLFAQAQKLWTLEDCIKYAWDNNLSIKQQELGVEQTTNTLFQSKMALAPSLSAQITENVNWGQSVDLSTLTLLNHVRSSNTGMGVYAELDLFTGLQKWNTIKSEGSKLQIAVQEVQKLKNEISIEITRYYMNVLLSKEILDAAKQSRESVSQQCERTRLLVNAGSQPLSSLLELESQLATEDLQVVDADNNLRTNYLSLKQLLDLSLDTEFEVVFPTIDQVDEYKPVSIEDLYYISQALPQIKKSEFTYEQRQHEMAIAKGGRYPRLSLSMGYSTFYSDAGRKRDTLATETGGAGDLLSGNANKGFWEQLGNNNNPSIGLTFSVPIFNKWQVNTNIKNARLSLQMAELELRNARQLLLKEIQQAANDATSTYLRCKATERNVKSMEESFRYVQNKFDIGLLNGTDYTVSKTNLFQAQSNFIQAKYEHVFKLKILDFYKGVPISL